MKRKEKGTIWRKRRKMEKRRKGYYRGRNKGKEGKWRKGEILLKQERRKRILKRKEKEKGNSMKKGEGWLRKKKEVGKPGKEENKNKEEGKRGK